MVRYANGLLMSRIEEALKELDASRFAKRLNVLRGLLERLVQDTRMSNPGISQDAKGLSRAIYDSEVMLDHKTLSALSGVRQLLEEVLF